MDWYVAAIISFSFGSFAGFIAGILGGYRLATRDFSKFLNWIWENYGTWNKQAEHPQPGSVQVAE